MYYWLTNDTHAKGDIIEPGNWGRTIRGNPQHRWSKMERQFEYIRLQTDAALPSRLAAAYLFIDVETAKILQQKRGDKYCYRVKLVDETAPRHVADMALVHPELEIYNAQWGNPRKYWEKRPLSEIQWPELLTLSPFIIVGEK